MSTHSSILAWRIPRTVKSLGLQRVKPCERDLKKKKKNINIYIYIYLIKLSLLYLLY